MVAEEVAGPSNAEYAAAKPKKAKIKPSLFKRPCAAVRSPLADVGLARTARCRPEIDFDSPVLDAEASRWQSVAAPHAV